MSTQPSADPADEIAIGLKQALDIHGHGFQYRAVAECHNVSAGQMGTWKVVDAERVFDLNGSVGHIDGVLELTGNPLFDDVQVLACIECKRVDPALGRWSFVRTPFGLGERQLDSAVFDWLHKPQNDTQFRQRAMYMKAGQAAPFGLAAELKTNRKGDGIGGCNNLINKAFAQVLRGTSGLYGERLAHGTGNKGLIVLPIVITTAELWTTDYSAGGADLETGAAGSFKVFKWDKVKFNVRATRDLMLRDTGTIRVGRAPSILTVPPFIRDSIDRSTRTIWVTTPGGIDNTLIEVARMLADLPPWEG